MKVTALLLFLAASSATASLKLNSKLSPVTRVVELLKGLAKQIEQEGHKEEDLYETFVCWGKTVIDTKTATNKQAEARIEELENYIADIDAGRVEFTSERVDLEKEIKSLSDSIEEATRLRAKEHEDFLQAEDEMDKAIAAMDKAIQVLADATAGHETGVLLQQKAKETLGLGEGFAERTADAAALDHAVQLGEKFLSKGDARFLQRLLTGEVPKADWKKLNRKANFKKSYKARSFKIQDTLKKLQATFTDNLAEARTKEADSKKSFDDLMVTKNEQLTAAQEALKSGDVEGGARGMSKEESQEEVDALKTQVENDKKFIEQVTGELADKKSEWKDRITLREAELAAVGKAIKILYSDDSRDMFKKSFKSQVFFLQEGSETRFQSQAIDAIRSVARRVGDQRLFALATLASTGHFDEVIEAIDKMIATLKGEEQGDLANKEECEKDRMEDTRDAILASREIDEMTDHITKLQQEIAELKEQIADNMAQTKSIEKEIEDATRIRDDERAAWTQSDKDDKAAAELVQQARDVLATFYKDSGLMDVGLLQKKDIKVVAGEAPPPPPTTWEAPYGGKTDESTGIIMCLEMVKEDIVADYTKADAAEKKAEDDYNGFMDRSSNQLMSLADATNKMNGSVADKETTIEEVKTSRGNTKDSLDATIKKIKDAEPGCNYATINYAVRASNRQIEIDGLDKAKAILNGAVFNAGPDPNRAMKPGDALLLQRGRKTL